MTDQPLEQDAGGFDPIPTTRDFLHELNDAARQVVPEGPDLDAVNAGAEATSRHLTEDVAQDLLKRMTDAFWAEQMRRHAEPPAEP